jgi:hypothetical protein
MGVAPQRLESRARVGTGWRERYMKRTGLAAGVLMAAAALAFPALSQAQVLGDIFGSEDARASRHERYGYEDAYRIGYDKGFEDGLKRGSKDRTKGDEHDLIHDPRYRKGDAGYKKSYGPRQDYITGYRDGYEQAYRRGYRTGDETRGRYPADRDDPYGYGRDDRWRTEPDDRDGGWEERDERDDEDDDEDYDEDVVYEEPPGRW